jgi:hypothetical protein
MKTQEKLREKLRLMTNKIGLIQMVKSIGLEELFEKTEGFDFLTEEELRKSIQECVDIVGPMGYTELGIEPILWRETRDEIHQIEYFSGNRVKVQVWEGYNYNTDGGEYHVKYEMLNKDQLMLILYGFLDFIETEMILR